MCMYMYVCMYVYVYVYIYIYTVMVCIYWLKRTRQKYFPCLTTSFSADTVKRPLPPHRIYDVCH